MTDTMNTDYITKHTANSHHLADIAQTHNIGIGIHHDTDHMGHMGITIPDEVLRQLKMLLGENVHTLSSHELDKATMNFKANGKVIRDAGGNDLHDMMHEHWGEAETSQKWVISAPERFEWNNEFETDQDEELALHADDTPAFSFTEMLNPIHAAEKVLSIVMM